MGVVYPYQGGKSMEYNKSKWELKYEEFKNGNMSKKLETMKEKIKDEANKFNEAIKNGKNDEAQKAQDEINKLQGDIKEKEAINTSVKSNSSKIENILQLKKDLVQDSVELLNKKREIDQYQKAGKTIKDSDKEVAKLVKDIEGIDKQIKQLNQQINQPNISSEDRKKLESDKENLKQQRKQKETDIGKHNSGKYLDALKDEKEMASKVNAYNVKDINAALAKNEKLIAKCDMIGKNLMNGKHMEEISTKLNNFTFTPDKDFEKSVTTLGNVYEKEKNKVEAGTRENFENIDLETKNLYGKIKKAMEQEKEAEEEYKKAEEEYSKRSNLPVAAIPWYRKIPVLKKIVSFVSEKFGKETNNATHISADDVKAKLEQLEGIKKEVRKLSTEFRDKYLEAEKAKNDVQLITNERSINYLEELRNQQDENAVLEGMALYGDIFVDKLNFKIPNAKTNLSKDEINKAKSMNKKEYVMSGHDADKRMYNVDARKAMIRKNIEDLKKKNEMKSHDDEGR